MKKVEIVYFQGHLVAKGHMSVLCQHCQKAPPLKLLSQFHLKFICSLIAKGKKLYIFGVDLMTKDGHYANF